MIVIVSESSALIRSHCNVILIYSQNRFGRCPRDPFIRVLAVSKNNINGGLNSHEVECLSELLMRISSGLK